MNLEHTTLKYIKKHQLIAPNQTIVIGVSGGPDSIALASVLNQIKHTLGIQLVIAHYNHNLRTHSKEDKVFVENFAQKLNIPFISDEWRNPKIKKQQSTEEEARKKRFNFFEKVSNNKKTVVALAHTQDDLAETVLMRILRGSGLKGLQAILPSRKINNTIYIRPFLEITKKDILNYLKQQKIKFVVDQTNTDTKFLRNKIRIQLMPYLQKNYNGNIQKILAQLSQNTTVDYEFLQQETEKHFKRLAQIHPSSRTIQFEIKKFLNKPLSLQNMLIRQAVIYFQGDTNKLSYTHLDEIHDLIKNRPFNSIVDLSPNLRAKKDKSRLVIFKNR